MELGREGRDAARKRDTRGTCNEFLLEPEPEQFSRRTIADKLISRGTCQLTGLDSLFKLILSLQVRRKCTPPFIEWGTAGEERIQS